MMLGATFFYSSSLYTFNTQFLCVFRSLFLSVRLLSTCTYISSTYIEYWCDYRTCQAKKKKKKKEGCASIAHMMRLCTRSFLKNEEARHKEREREREKSTLKAKDEGQRRVCTYVHHRPLFIVIFQSSSSSFLIIYKQFQKRKV